MATYNTLASFIIPLSPVQLDFAVSVLSCVEDEKLDLTKKHKTKAAKAYNSSVYRLAKRFAKKMEGYDPEFAYSGFSWERGSGGLWISHDESIHTDNAAMFTHLLLKHFDIEGYVAIEASHDCDRPRLDAFGGHAFFVTKNALRMTTTCKWVYQQAKRSGLQPVGLVA